MKRIEGILTRLFIVISSAVLAFMIIEVAANYYLWNLAPEADFKQLASINQIKERYGDDFFISSNTDRSVDARVLSPHHYLGYFPAPNLRLGENQHNSFGFRGDQIAGTKGENTLRVFMVGGSTTYSTGVDNYRHSYPYLFEKYIHGKGIDHVEVINAGVGGYDSYRNLINILFRVLPLQPDLLVIYQGFNDIDPRLVYPYSDYLGDNSGYIAPFVSDTVMPEIWEYSSALRILGIRAGLTKSHSAVDWHRRSPATSA